MLLPIRYGLHPLILISLSLLISAPNTVSPSFVEKNFRFFHSIIVQVPLRKFFSTFFLIRVFVFALFCGCFVKKKNQSRISFAIFFRLVITSRIVSVFFRDGFHAVF